MRLALPIEAVDRTVDGAVEIVGVDEGAIGEVMAFEIAPGMFDLVQLRRIFGQPFDGEPPRRSAVPSSWLCSVYRSGRCRHRDHSD